MSDGKITLYNGVIKSNKIIEDLVNANLHYSLVSQVKILKTIDLNTWVLNNITGTGTSTFLSLCFGNGIYIAVSDDGNIYNSSNGTDWSLVYTRPSIPGSNPWGYPWSRSINKVIYSNRLRLFVAVADSANIITSPNGTNWTLHSISTGNFNDVIDNGTVLVAVGDTIVSSTNGILWTVRQGVVTAPSTDPISFGGVTWDGTKFIAAGSADFLAFFYVSTNLTTWTPTQDIGTDTICYDMA
jgi:hypothetical protein